MTDEMGVLKTSKIYFHTPGNMAKRLFFYLLCAGEYFCREGYHVKREHYDSFLILYIVRGKGSVYFNGRSQSMSEHDVVLLDCYAAHEYSTDESMDTLWLHFDGNVSREFFNQIYAKHGCILSFSSRPIVTDYIETLVEGTYKNELPEALVSCYIHRILTDLLLYNSDDPLKDNSNSNYILEAKEYIEINCGKKLALHDIASHVNMSVYHFSRQFKKETGYAPYEYIIKSRINRSKLLLKRTAHTIGEIAEESGFSGVSNYISTFRRFEGLTPVKFRNTPF